MWLHAYQKYACFQNYLLDCFLKGETWAWCIPCTAMKSPLLCQVTLEICISEKLAVPDSFHRLAEMPGHTVMCVLMRLEVIRELLLGLLNPTQRTHLKWQISQISCRSLCSPPESKGVVETWEGSKKTTGEAPSPVQTRLTGPSSLLPQPHHFTHVTKLLFRDPRPQHRALDFSTHTASDSSPKPEANQIWVASMPFLCYC